VNELLIQLLPIRNPLQMLVHMGIKPHIDKPPGAPQIIDRFTQQELLGYLMKEMIGRTQKVLAKGELVTIC